MPFMLHHPPYEQPPQKKKISVQHLTLSKYALCLLDSWTPIMYWMKEQFINAQRRCQFRNVYSNFIHICSFHLWKKVVV